MASPKYTAVGSDAHVDVRPLSLQAAGHRALNGRNLDLLEENGGKFVLKPLNGERELEFYEFVFNVDCVDPVVVSLRRFVPKFYGVRSLERTSGSASASASASASTCTTYLRLENLTHEFEHASIMDVKIGRVTCEPGASAEKKEREKSKYVNTKIPLGYCIPGFKVYNEATASYEEFDRKYGKSLDQVKVKSALGKFLGDEKSTRMKLASGFVEEMQLIRDWFDEQRLFNFYASSLLFVYSSNPLVIPLIRIVDFVHVIKSDSRDENFLFGLNNLIEAINEMRI